MLSRGQSLGYFSRHQPQLPTFLGLVFPDSTMSGSKKKSDLALQCRSPSSDKGPFMCQDTCCMAQPLSAELHP